MVNIITEDSSDGFDLIKDILDTDYKTYSKYIKLISANGVDNIPKIIEEDINKYTNKNNTTIIVFDYIIENESVVKYINEIADYADNYSNIYLVKTKSFEVEALMIDDIQLLGNIDEYNKYFKTIKSLLAASGGATISATRFVTTQPQYKEMIDNAIKDKVKSRHYQQIAKTLDKDTYTLVKNSITIETISKKILTKVFENQMIPIKKCWTEDCCYNDSMCKHIYLDIAGIREKQINCEKYKLKIFIANTKYLGVFIELDKALSKELNTTIDKASGIQGRIKDLMYKANVPLAATYVKRNIQRLATRSINKKVKKGKKK